MAYSSIDKRLTHLLAKREREQLMRLKPRALPVELGPWRPFTVLELTLGDTKVTEIARFLEERDAVECANHRGEGTIRCVIRSGKRGYGIGWRPLTNAEWLETFRIIDSKLGRANT